ncbi:diacylglycerol O-acyltransferase 1-like [Thrips palmi]|uniref:O-acyltransferase n=1 Tax=Thrips palmi TaxID=161013 RepID=A0A6P8YYS8_THRPL|nr:diacylglycerol O-acyltransferase 1-like [Thrips palmi]
MSPGSGSELRLRDKDTAKAATNNNDVKPAPFKSPLDNKCHRERSAFITWNNTKSVSLKGFMNLLFCLTTLAAAGLLLENMNKYGFRVALANWIHAVDARQNVAGFYPALLLLLYMPVQIFVALGIEKAIALELVPERDGMKAHVVNMLWHFAYPIAGIWLAGDAISIVGGYCVCQFNAMVFLKMWSFVHACWWARDKRRHEAQQAQNGVGDGTTTMTASIGSPVAPDVKETVYPDNLTVGNLAYFTVAPTLCYEMDYPRKPSINWRRVAVRAAMLLVVGTLHAAMIQQWLIPSFTAVAGPIARNEWSVVAERLLKIAVPTNLVWLVFFYQLFHVNMILVSELTRFADRRSYDNWWDSEDMNVYWRRWNLPVHYWCVRHLYLPMRRAGYTKTVAKWATFVFSGVFHEYLVSPPIRMFRVYAFLAMVAQMPIGDFSEWVCRKFGVRWGNAVVWFTIVIGQPLSIIMYVRDYQLAYNGPGGLTALELSVVGVPS